MVGQIKKKQTQGLAEKLIFSARCPPGPNIDVWPVSRRAQTDQRWRSWLEAWILTPPWDKSSSALRREKSCRGRIVSSLQPCHVARGGSIKSLCERQYVIKCTNAKTGRQAEHDHNMIRVPDKNIKCQDDSLPRVEGVGWLDVQI